jgi:transcription antitermination protein NusB
MTISVRHQARILVMQALYEWDSADHVPVVALERQLRERGVAARVAEFARSLLGGVQAHLQQIDEHLAVAAPQRPLTQMARVEKAILRLAIFEILYNNNAVPSRAAINEAIELAKTYGSENSGRFVNGVLGTIFSHAESSISDNTTSRK